MELWELSELLELSVFLLLSVLLELSAAGSSGTGPHAKAGAGKGNARRPPVQEQEALSGTEGVPEGVLELTEAMIKEAVAELAESAQHHPDILIRWNKVTLTLSTHDAGGLTERDFLLAKSIDRLV